MTRCQKPLWHIRDLVTDAKTGKLQERKLWSNLGKAAMTFGFIWAVLHAQGSEWLWMSYGGVILGHAILDKRQDQQGEKDKAP